MQDSIQALDFLSQGFYNGRKYIFMKPLSKIKHQIKSGKYYIFWGACTIAVMAGQIYVGAGYRSMTQEVKDLTEMVEIKICLLYTSPSPRDLYRSRMPSSA